MDDNNMGKSSKQKAASKDHLEEIKRLALAIDQVEDEKLEVTNQLKRALADYQNLEKSIDSRTAIRSLQLKRALAEGIIGVMDDLMFGVEASRSLNLEGAAASWLEGMLTTISKMEKVIGELGVKRMEVHVGESFDSNRHEAISTIDGELPGTVAQIVSNGYLIDDEVVIRPAKVIVVKSK